MGSPIVWPGPGSRLLEDPLQTEVALQASSSTLSFAGPMPVALYLGVYIRGPFFPSILKEGRGGGGPSLAGHAPCSLRV